LNALKNVSTGISSVAPAIIGQSVLFSRPRSYLCKPHVISLTISTIAV
jgi:hypothetical protein